MSRAVPLFDNAGRPTPFLMRQWTQKGAQQPLQSRVQYLDREKRAEPRFRTLWQIAFPARNPLPSEPLADGSGRGTDAFWDVFA